MKQKLTEKRLKLLKEIKEDPTASMSELGRRVGMSAAGVSQALENPNLKNRIRRFQEVLERREALSDERLADCLERGLSATKPNPFGPEEIPDHRARHLFFESTVKARGLIEEKEEQNVAPQVLIINAIQQSIQEGLSE